MKIDRNFSIVEININVIAMGIHEVPKRSAKDETKIEATNKNKEVKE